MKPKPVNPQPSWAIVGCNDAVTDADLILSVGTVRLHFEVKRNGKTLSSFAVTKGQARELIMWLAQYA